MSKIDKAWEFAQKAHTGQLYPGTKLPYTVHLNQTKDIIVDAFEKYSQYDDIDKFNMEFTIICALLHDTIEDTWVDYDNIALIFGIDVADSVSALTKLKTIPRNSRLLDSLQRIKDVRVGTSFVKLADRIANLSNVPPAHWSRNKIYNYIIDSKLIENKLKLSNSISQYLCKELSKKIRNWEDNFLKESKPNE